MERFVADPLSGLPIGPEVAAHAAPHPQRRIMEGRFIRVEPLSAERHTASLWRETHGPAQDARWQYLFEAPFADEDSFRDHLVKKAASEDPMFFAIVDPKSGNALGYEALMRIETANRCIEIGSILYGPRLQRHAGGTEAQFLPMKHAFDDLGYRRYEWKCNALNAPSRAAAVRLGFTLEGVFRQHMIIRGRNRDTAWYSIIDSEWPKVKEAFVRWLAPDNFDSDGAQKQSLVAIRRSL
ncbi:MAG: GNAT family N-acetyltransferase [Steroidobacteraceae bacterium]